jgi:hypothetical protein
MYEILPTTSITLTIDGTEHTVHARRDPNRVDKLLRHLVVELGFDLESLLAPTQAGEQSEKFTNIRFNWEEEENV